MKIKSLLSLASVLLLLACTDDVQKNHPTPEGDVVERTFAVTALPMQQADGTPETRSAMSNAETAIHALRFVQFDGVEATSVVCRQGEVTLTDGKATLPLLPYSVFTRVYLLANMEQPAVTPGTTTLADFENMSVAFEPVASLANGLPMSAFADVIPMDASAAPAFALESMVARVSVTMSIDPAIVNQFVQSPPPAVYLCSAASGTTFSAPADLATPHRPAGVTFAGDIELGAADGTTYTYYVAENCAGRNAAVKRLTQRSQENAQPDALCFELRGKVTDYMDVVFSLFGGDASVMSDFNVKRGCAYALTGTLKGLNRADERLNAVLLNLSAHGTANCYIVTDNLSRKYNFDATKRGNGYESTTDPNVSGISYSTLPDLSTATEARVIWQTGNSATELMIDPASLRLENNKVYFSTTGKMVQGNAVIGIFPSSDPTAECLWSWHIWKLDGAEPGTVTGTKISATTGSEVPVTILDRNLGAFNDNINSAEDASVVGLLYQWGRKDPFPGPTEVGGYDCEPTNIYGTYNNGGVTGSWNGTYIRQRTVNDSEAWPVKYPAIFMGYHNIGPYDWLQDSNPCLWGTPWEAGGTGDFNKNQGVKSIYDPCPVGYRVPPHDTGNKMNFSVPRIMGRYFETGFLSNTYGSVYFLSSPANPNDYKEEYAAGFYSTDSYWKINYALIPVERSRGGAIRCAAE